MRILIVGASGTIGRAIAAELGQRHEVLTAGRSSGDVRLDITDAASIRAAFETLLETHGPLDAVISAAGSVKFAPFEQMQAADYEIGLRDKLMGQVQLVLIGREHLNDGGSFTLTTGVLDSDPIRQGTSASMVNGAINAFVMAAAIEMPRGLRINVVSPGVIEEAMKDYAPYFRGFEPVPAARAALAYAKSVEGAQTGKVYRVL
ncbi:MAG: short chain dehydrogenase [Thermoanaerobaculia bacterium]|nr:short chain dehydrogenase [Thermoanaerobaculia bacterium]